MSGGALAQHLLYVAALALLSAGLTWLMVHRVRVLDEPNHRSSHAEPTPKSGGVGIVGAFLAGMGLVTVLAVVPPAQAGRLLAFTGACVLVAAVSFYDDLKSRPLHVKLAAQIGAAALALAGGVVPEALALPGAGTVAPGPAGYLLALLWILGLTNAFNFMDGLNGLAGGTGLIVAAFFAAAAWVQGSVLVHLVCLALAAGTAGFLVFNFPRARIFMGDVGSAFLGFAFALLALLAAGEGPAHVPLLVVPLLLLSFIWDTAFTFARRALAGENVAAAHRSHLYQLLNRTGYSHAAVTLLHWAVAAAQGLAALLMLDLEAGRRLLLFLPFLALHVLYTVWVMGRARRAGLMV